MPAVSVDLLDASAAMLAYECCKNIDTPYASLDYVRAYQSRDFAASQHAVARRDGEVVALLSLVIEHRCIRILNRLTPLQPDVFQELVAFIFKQFPASRRIEFEGVYAPSIPVASAVPLRAWVASNDFIVQLPESVPTYMTVFGSKTQKNLRYCANRLKREHPSAAFEVVSGTEIDASIVSSVVRLNHLRMRKKGRKSAMDAAYERNLHGLLQQRGIAVVIRDEDRVLAGVLCTRIHSGWSLHVISHDPEFNHLRLGLLCLLRVIEQAIECRAYRFHFLWGESDYKKLFGARRHDLYSLRCYRTSLAKWFSVPDQIEKVRSELAVSMPVREAKRLLRFVRDRAARMSFRS